MILKTYSAHIYWNKVKKFFIANYCPSTKSDVRLSNDQKNWVRTKSLDVFPNSKELRNPSKFFPPLMQKRLETLSQLSNPVALLMSSVVCNAATSNNITFGYKIKVFLFIYKYLIICVGLITWLRWYVSNMKL